MLVESGHSADDPGYFGTALKQHSTDRVSLRLALLDSAWLRSIDPIPYDTLDPRDLDALATPLARHARTSGARVIFSPFIEATI
jgi:hypothetical protein